eukprot:1795771-Lingulodinium_polyedra.AAC.1
MDETCTVKPPKHKDIRKRRTAQLIGTFWRARNRRRGWPPPAPATARANRGGGHQRRRRLIYAQPGTF